MLPLEQTLERTKFETAPRGNIYFPDILTDRSNQY